MRTARRSGKKGSALVVTFIVVILVGLVCSSMFGYSGHQQNSSRRTTDFIKAKVIAEAGANKAYNMVKHDFAAVSDDSLFPETTLGDGTYDVTMTIIGTNKAKMVSLGRCGTAEASVTADLLNQERRYSSTISPDSPFDPAIFTNYCVLAGGMIEWRGGGVIESGGLVRANGIVDMNGGGEFRGPSVKVYSSFQVKVQGSSYIRGDTYAPSYDGKLDQITGTRSTTTLPLLKIPAIDLLSFSQHAAKFNQVRSGSVLINSDFSPVGGVLWVNGDLKISNGRCNGCFIATGNIEISTSDEMNALNGYPLLISRDGVIKITSTPTLNGLVYARNGSIDWTGGGNLRGSLVAAQDIDKGGGSDLIVDFSRILPVMPGTGSGATNKNDYVIISAWQE